MKIDRRRLKRFTPIVLVLFLLMATAASAIAIKPIGSGVDPATDGNMAAWARADGKEVHLYDLATWKDSKIKTSLSCYPDIDSNTLVWCENGKASRLVVYNIKMAQVSYISPVEAWTKPAISNGKIVWSSKGGINIYDVLTKEKAFVSNGYNPDISGDNIAYEAVDINGEHDIAIYNIVSKTTIIVQHEGDLTYPQISGDYIVFRDEMGNLAQFILATGGYKVINENNIPGHSDERELYSYALRGPMVVYDKAHNGPMGLAGIYVYDDGLPVLSPLSITGDKTGANVAISGDSSSGFNIVWGFVANAESAKKVNGGIYVSAYSPIKTGHLYINTGGDEAKIAIYQNGKLILAKSGRNFDVELPIDEYMLVLSGMGNPATVTSLFNVTEEGVHMDFPNN